MDCVGALPSLKFQSDTASGRQATAVERERERSSLASEKKKEEEEEDEIR